jgi:hypothetical protein
MNVFRSGSGLSAIAMSFSSKLKISSQLYHILELKANSKFMVLFSYLPHPLYPPLLSKERGRGINKEGLTPLLDTLIKGCLVRGLKGAEPL